MYDRFIQGKLLSGLSTFAIGGPARYFIEVKEIALMQEVLRFCHTEKLAYFILGKGSNCLFDDKGFNGLVILNKIDFCKELSPGKFYVGAGYSFSLLGTQTAKKGFSGLEFAAGIPASVGGAVCMNAGAQSSETKDTLSEVEYIDAEGVLKCFQREELLSSFSYRTSPFQNRQGAIVSATFCLEASKEARSKQLVLLDYRMGTQPYHEKSAGCVFRNPVRGSAGALIDKCGLKGVSVGGAKVSEMHANFLVNANGATAADMKGLIHLVQSRVKELCGIELEQEIRLING